MSFSCMQKDFSYAKINEKFMILHLIDNNILTGTIIDYDKEVVKLKCSKHFNELSKEMGIGHRIMTIPLDKISYYGMSIDSI